MNKQKDTRYTGRYPDKKIGYLRRTTVSLYSADRQNGLYPNIKGNIFDAKERISFFYPIFVLATN